MYYDSLNRLIGKHYQTDDSCPTSNPTYNSSYTYDSGTNGKGHRTGMSDASGSTTWTYDSRRRISSESKVITGGGTYNTSWTYNSADLPLTMTYPGGEVVTNTYNTRMLLNSVIGTNTYVSDTDHDSAGRMDLRTFGNSQQTDYVYFPWNSQGGRLQFIQSGSSGSPTSLQNLEYAYDAAGNVDWIKDWKAGSPQLQDFTYDTLDRLTGAVVTGGTGGLYNETYGYNATTGNLETKAGVTLQYNNSAHKHAATNMGSNTYQYDANGNMTQRVGGQTFNLAYDAENRLISVSGAVTASFVYDGDGQRIKSVINGVTTYFVGNYYEKTGSTATKYYYAGAQRVAMRAGSTLSYLLTDHLGSTSLTTNASGGVVSELRYKAWGETRYTSGTMPTKYTYTGQYSNLSDFGLMFYNARWYDPALGRFAQADTIIPQAQGVQAWDRYAFVNNNPVRYTDPSGYCIGPLTCVLTWLGILPDFRGLVITTMLLGPNDAVVGAGLAVQSQYYLPIWDDPTNPLASSYGPAQISDVEMSDLGITDPHDGSSAVLAMENRISSALAACNKCQTDTDNLILAAIVQNGGLDIKGIKSLPTLGKGGPIDWETVLTEWGGNTSDPIAGLRQGITGMKYNTKFMLKLFMNDLGVLLDLGYTLPDEFDDANLDDIWTYLEPSGDQVGAQ
jgi:RHS repeat-associated protein